MYSLLLLQEALRLQARTVYRTVTGSSPVAGAHLVRRLAEKTKYSCVAQSIRLLIGRSLVQAQSQEPPETPWRSRGFVVFGLCSIK